MEIRITEEALAASILNTNTSIVNLTQRTEYLRSITRQLTFLSVVIVIGMWTTVKVEKQQMARITALEKQIKTLTKSE